MGISAYRKCPVSRYWRTARANPGQPLGLDRDDEEEQELQVGIEGGKGEEHGHIDIVHGRGAHQKAHQNVQQNAEEIENGELVGTPLPLQGVADEVVEVEGDGKQENVSAGGGDKDKGNDPPDLPL